MSPRTSPNGRPSSGTAFRHCLSLYQGTLGILRPATTKRAPNRKGPAGCSSPSPQHTDQGKEDPHEDRVSLLWPPSQPARPEGEFQRARCRTTENRWAPHGWADAGMVHGIGHRPHPSGDRRPSPSTGGLERPLGASGQPVGRPGCASWGWAVPRIRPRIPGPPSCGEPPDPRLPGERLSTSRSISIMGTGPPTSQGGFVRKALDPLRPRGCLGPPLQRAWPASQGASGGVGAWRRSAWRTFWSAAERG